MFTSSLMETMPRARQASTLLVTGRIIYSFAIIGLGVETIVTARHASHVLGPRYDVIPVLPWLPAIPWLAYVVGAVWILCGAGILVESTSRLAAGTLSAGLFLAAIVLVAPKYAVRLADISLRTVVFETLAIAALAWLSAGPSANLALIDHLARWIVAASLVVFGVDHFLALRFIADLIPQWIPWHVFWVAFFGLAMIAAGLSIGLKLLDFWGAAGVGLMFGVWVITLHLPRVLGFYGIPGAFQNPDEWSSLLIAIALWGGPWALAAWIKQRPRM